MSKDKKVEDAPSGDAGKKNKKVKEDFKTQAEENLAGWKKALADYQNLQKEMDQRLSSMSNFVSSAFILELLPIFDNYQIAIEHIPEEQKKESWAVGLEHILKMWESFLNDHQIEKIKTVGEKFDPNIHESVGSVKEKDQDDQIIVEEKLAGYRTKESAIRPAKVIINNK
ncbi:nucleotide exchange factor GrpE [Candidatus Parcubacteria bacterium]|nr:MAG: nucleotide exchange factor GrpE [Candidatus Parcubacteria bacterium]